MNIYWLLLLYAIGIEGANIASEQPLEETVRQGYNRWKVIFRKIPKTQLTPKEKRIVLHGLLYILFSVAFLTMEIVLIILLAGLGITHIDNSQILTYTLIACNFIGIKNLYFLVRKKHMTGIPARTISVVLFLCYGCLLYFLGAFQWIGMS